MQELLMHKLYAYVGGNNPELLLELQQEKSVTDWLMEKVEAIDTTFQELISKDTPVYEIEEQCMALLTAELKPSRYQFIRNLLEEEFTKEFGRLENGGNLVATIIEMIPICEEAFQRFGFYDGKEVGRLLHYTITGLLHERLHDLKK